MNPATFLAGRSRLESPANFEACSRQSSLLNSGFNVHAEPSYCFRRCQSYLTRSWHRSPRASLLAEVSGVTLGIHLEHMADFLVPLAQVNTAALKRCLQNVIRRTKLDDSVGDARPGSFKTGSVRRQIAQNGYNNASLGLAPRNRVAVKSICIRTHSELSPGRFLRSARAFRGEPLSRACMAENNLRIITLSSLMRGLLANSIYCFVI